MKTASEKETIITIMVGCIVLFIIFSSSVFWIVALTVGLAGIASDKLTHWIHLAWFKLADILGFIMSKIILGILFIAVLLPVATLAKLFRKDIMMMKKNYPSYFVDRNITYEPKDLENPW
jgi:hypothetical protein